jgi:hypothetical protein
MSPPNTRLPFAFLLISSLAYSFILKMEVTYSSETSVDCQWTTCYVPEHRTLRNHRCENLKSYTSKISLKRVNVKFVIKFPHASPPPPPRPLERIMGVTGINSERFLDCNHLLIFRELDLFPSFGKNMGISYSVGAVTIS